MLSLSPHETEAARVLRQKKRMDRSMSQSFVGKLEREYKREMIGKSAIVSVCNLNNPQGVFDIVLSVECR